VTGSWRRLVFASPKLEPPLIDRPAYVFCVLEALHGALRRRDVYAVGADKWGDPRARLIELRLWVRERATVLTALGLPTDPREHLTRLAEVLDGAFKQVGAGLAANTAARIKDGKLSLARLEAAPPPEGFQAVHDAVATMLPRIDYPELLLEVNAHTGFLDAIPHISGSEARRDDLDLSLAALLVARSCNIGLTPLLPRLRGRGDGWVARPHQWFGEGVRIAGGFQQQHAIAGPKQWRPLQRCIGRREHFDDTMLAVTGLVSGRCAGW
jgi:hypothetical protein